MFAKLTAPPSRPVEAEFLPTLFSDTQIRITVTTAKGRESKDYAVNGDEFDFKTYGVSLLCGEDEYAVAVTSRGEGSCDCENFEREGRYSGHMCKHLFACCHLGLLPWPANVERPKPKQEPINGCDEKHASEQPSDRGAARVA